MWLVKGRLVLKASPKQLRRATHREGLLEAQADPSDQQTPWRFHRVAEQIGGSRFEDIFAEVPEESERQRA